MPEVEEQLRRYAAAAERSVRPADRMAGARRRPVRWLAVSVAAAIIGAAIIVTLDDDRSRISTDPSIPDTSAPATSSSATDGPTTTAPATSSLRTFPVTATIECGPGADCVKADQYLVWSGEAGSEAAVRADGFAVDLSSGAVRPIPVAPIAPRSGATGVWTGQELLVCCGTGQADGYAVDTTSAAAWDPETGEWRVLADPPAEIARSYPASVWTGELMVVITTDAGAAAYDPSADAWQEIPAPEARGRRPEAAWTGAEVILWDPVYGGGVADRGWRWAPGQDGWRALPDLPAGYRTTLGSMAWTGSDLVVWGQSSDDESLGVGARWNLGGGGWRPMGAWPHNPVEDPFNGTPGSQTLAATDDGRVLVTGLGGSDAAHTDLYDPVSDTWLDLGFTIDGFHPHLTVVGDQVLIPDEARPIAGRLPG